MTSPPVAPAVTTLAAAPHPGDPRAAVTVVLRVPVASDAMARAGALVEDGRSVTTGFLRLAVIVAVIGVLVAGRIVRASGVGRC
jgi:hypothetical protein